MTRADQEEHCAVKAVSARLTFKVSVAVTAHKLLLQQSRQMYTRNNPRISPSVQANRQVDQAVYRSNRIYFFLAVIARELPQQAISSSLTLHTTVQRLGLYELYENCEAVRSPLVDPLRIMHDKKLAPTAMADRTEALRRRLGDTEEPL